MIVKNIQWFRYKRGGVAFIRLYPVIIGYHTLYSRYFRVPFGQLIYSTTNKGLDWLQERQWMIKLGNDLIEKLLTRTVYAKQFRYHWQKLYDAAREISFKIIFELSSKNLTQKELEENYLKLFDVMLHFHTLSGIGVDAIDEALAIQIQDQLKARFKKREQVEKLFNILTTPVAPTFTRKKDFALLSLAKSIKESGAKIEDPKWQAQIKALERKYWWTTLGWVTSARLTASRIKTEIESLMQSKDLETQYQQHREFGAKTDQIKQAALREIKAARKLRRLIDFLEDVAFLREQRKEVQLYMFEAQDEILKEILRRKRGLKFSEIQWLKTEEALAYFQGVRGFRKIIEKRKTRTLCIINRDQLTIQEGLEAQKLHALLIQEDVAKDIRSLKGLPASPGKVKGKVIVSNDPAFLEKNIKPGQIIVASQTLPDFVPAMKKAAAIITEEGGATSHAAIISRELGIPCVVATKIATQVLKTGDQVSVDATKGIIIIIS